MDALSQRQPRIGVTQWRNPRNGLVVVRLHYTADPRKRAPEWKTTAARNMSPRDWRREYEVDWTSPEGEPVTPEFQPATHVKEFTWDSTLRLLRWWDFGFVSPVCLFAQVTPWGQVRVRRELCPFNTPLDQLWDGVLAVTQELAGGGLREPTDAYDVTGEEPPEPLGVFDAGDPAAANQTDLGSSAEFLGRRGVMLHTNRPGTEISYSNLRALLLRQVMEPGAGPHPAVIVHPDCHNLIAAASGAFHLSIRPPYRPVKKHPEKDVMDAWRYGVDNLRAVSRQYQQALSAMAQADIQPTRATREREYRGVTG